MAHQLIFINVVSSKQTRVHAKDHDCSKLQAVRPAKFPDGHQ